jgi:hypothetical protein
VNCLRSSRMADSFKIIITHHGFTDGVVSTIYMIIYISSIFITIVRCKLFQWLGSDVSFGLIKRILAHKTHEM